MYFARMGFRQASGLAHLTKSHVSQAARARVTIRANSGMRASIAGARVKAANPKAAPRAPRRRNQLRHLTIFGFKEVSDIDAAQFEVKQRGLMEIAGKLTSERLGFRFS
jgi:hypothetical protein